MSLKQRKIVNAIVAAAITASVGLSADAAPKTPPMEKCYGIVKAGKNDCGSSHGNACAAQSKRDNDPNAWIFLPKGTCDKIVGGSTTPPSTNSNPPATNSK